MEKILQLEIYDFCMRCIVSVGKDDVVSKKKFGWRREVENQK
jgi:hypothetical protein